MSAVWAAAQRRIVSGAPSSRRKLGDDAEQPRYILTEWGVGYRFVPPR